MKQLLQWPPDVHPCAMWKLLYKSVVPIKLLGSMEKPDKSTLYTGRLPSRYRPHPKDGGRYCFQLVCQSTPRQGGYPSQVWMVGGGHPSQVWMVGGGTPVKSGWCGGTPARSGWWVGTPARSWWWGGVPQPSLDGGGYPGLWSNFYSGHHLDGGGTPARSGWWGIPPQPGLDGGGVPWVPPHHDWMG